jgi:predicted metal-dependent phosphoesterase TrpH
MGARKTLLAGKTFKVDLHVHTCASKDSAVHPADVIKAAKRQGLDRICITDHNRIDGALVAKEIDPEFVIVGEEILTTHGELLAFFVSEWVPPFLAHPETLDGLEVQGAVVSVSHPFDRHRHPWTKETLEAILPRLDAVEGFNARSLHAQDNQRSQVFAARHNLPMTAGSDAHTTMEIGAAYLEIPSFTSAEEFRAGLAESTIHGRLSPVWVHFITLANKWRSVLGLKPLIGHSGAQHLRTRF